MSRPQSRYPTEDWGDRTPRTQIVAIGAPIKAQELSSQFNACIEQD
jgi:hypothetical protein